MPFNANQPHLRIQDSYGNSYNEQDGQLYDLRGNPTSFAPPPPSTTPLLKDNNLSDLANSGTARTSLGLGGMATQAANNVSVTGGAASGIALDTTTPKLVRNTTAPSAVTDGCHIYAADQAAGNSCPHVRTESGQVVKLYREAALTAPDSSAIDAIYTQTEADVITNIRTRLNETEARLKNLGIIA